MKNITESLLLVHPDMIERHCGGWLALSPKNTSLCIGVTGNTKEDAIARFSLSIRKWVETLYNTNNEKEER